MTLKPDDKFLVTRGNKSFHLENQNMAQIEDDDLMLVSRTGDDGIQRSYKVTGAEVKSSSGPPAAPPYITSAVLSEQTPGSPERFTNQKFDIDVANNASSSQPISYFLKAWVKGELLKTIKTSEITGVSPVASYADEFTYTGADYVGTYSYDPAEAYLMFNGDLTNWPGRPDGFGNQVKQEITWTPTVPVPCTSLQIFFNKSGGSPISVNGEFVSDGNPVAQPDIGPSIYMVQISMSSLGNQINSMTFGWGRNNGPGNWSELPTAIYINENKDSGGSPLTTAYPGTALTFADNTGLDLLSEDDFVTQDNAVGNPIYSSDLTADGGFENNSAYKAFDGDVNEAAVTSGNQALLQFNCSIPNVSKVEVWAYDGSANDRLFTCQALVSNKLTDAVADCSYGWKTLYEGTAGTLSTVTSRCNIVASSRIAAIRVNGSILIDGVGIRPSGFVSGKDVDNSILYLKDVSAGTQPTFLGQTYSDGWEGSAIPKGSQPYQGGYNAAFSGNQDQATACLVSPASTLNWTGDISFTEKLEIQYYRETGTMQFVFDDGVVDRTDIPSWPAGGATYTKTGSGKLLAINLSSTGSGGSSGIFSVTADGVMLADGPGWSANTGNYVDGPSKVEKDAIEYCLFNSNGVLDGKFLNGADPGYVEMTSGATTEESFTLTFPAMFPGETPDQRLPEDTQLQAEVWCTNANGEDKQETNAIEPKAQQVENISYRFNNFAFMEEGDSFYSGDFSIVYEPYTYLSLVHHDNDKGERDNPIKGGPSRGNRGSGGTMEGNTNTYYSAGYCRGIVYKQIRQPVELKVTSVDGGGAITGIEQINTAKGMNDRDAGAIEATLEGGSGSGATGRFDKDGDKLSVLTGIAQGGANYAVNDVITWTPDTGNGREGQLDSDWDMLIHGVGGSGGSGAKANGYNSYPGGGGNARWTGDGFDGSTTSDQPADRPPAGVGGISAPDIYGSRGENGSSGQSAGGGGGGGGAGFGGGFGGGGGKSVNGGQYYAGGAGGGGGGSWLNPIITNGSIIQSTSGDDNIEVYFNNVKIATCQNDWVTVRIDNATRSLYADNPEDVTKFNEIKDALESYEDDVAEFRKDLETKVAAANLTADEKAWILQEVER